MKLGKILAVISSVAVAIISRVRGTNAVQNFFGRARMGNRMVDCEHVFIECSSQEDARQRAKEKGIGAEPDLHSPHKPGNPDHFWHYHPGNHELFYENGTWRNYHYYWRGKPASGG